MANTIKEEELKIQAPAAPQQAESSPVTQAAMPTPDTPAAAQPNPYANLKGLSQNTQNQLGNFQNGYQMGDNVLQAQQYLQQLQQTGPGTYQSNYQANLQNLYDQVMNREKFQYDLNGDMLYKQYADQYQRAGKRAMQDTMGNAAALTGGYGSSYATTAGEQAYQQYLSQLNDKIPELYQMAADQYNREGDQLNNRFSTTAQMESQDYGRYRDQVADWNTNVSNARQDYQMAYNQGYQQWSDMLNYWNNVAQQESAQYSEESNKAYSMAMTMLQNGKMPDAATLELAGITGAEANTLYSIWAKKKSSGSSKKSSGGSPKPTIDTAKLNALKVKDIVNKTIKSFKNTNSLL